MSLFRVFVDNQLFYHPHLSQLSITEAKVQEDAENIDSLTLSAPFNHPYLSAIQPMSSTIVCKKDALTVFEGRALDDGTDFYNTHTWTCESCLAYLKDTMQPPFSYQGPLRGLLEQFLSVHNAAVEEKKQFTLGTVTVTDNNDYISYSNSDYSVTMDAIQDKLIKTHGGYLQVRYTDMGKFLDYLEDFPDRSLQTVEFGKNLTDVKITRDHTERVTALIPLGAKLTETDEDGNETETDTRLDITAVNDGKNYVYDEEAVEEIGWIWTTEIWEDVTLAGNLLRKANARLSELVKGVTSMELTIVDESDTGADIGDIRARMYVRCISKPHGIDGTYLCLSRTRDYLNPSGNTITIGAAGVRLTSESAKQDQNITSIEDELLGQTSKIEVITGKVDQINAQKMYRTELVVDGVNIFRDKGQRSVLRCRVYSWDKEITDTLPASSFVWHRNSGREDLDADWDSSHIGMKSITVTTEDVTDNASFYIVKSRFKKEEIDMPTVLTSSQQTFVDITDQRKLSAYITSNLPKSQIEDPNVLPHTYAPDWASTPLTLTPVVFLDQTNLALDASGLTISWKRKEGNGAEAALTSGESVSKGVLTVNVNKLAAATSGMLTYLCYISYYDSETKNTVNISADITYTLIRNAQNAKLAYLSADTYVFKYDSNSSLVGAKQATLTAQVQGVTITAWQYKDSTGAWKDYPTTSDNASISGGTLVVKPDHAVFFNGVAQIKLATDDPDVYDTTSLTKIYDGSQGEPGAAGTGGLSIILGNEAQNIACTSGGLVAAATEITIPFMGYLGIAQVACTCTVGTLPSGVTVKSNTAATASKAGSVVLSFAANATLGGATVLNGTIDLTFTVSGASVVKKFAWTKSNKGSNGASGANAIVFSVYAPEGTVVINQSGSLALAAVGYDGASEITTGATYQWAKYTGGEWEDISDETSSTLSVSGADIVNIQSYRCTMTYKGNTYEDVITVEDKSDPYVSEMLSIGGFTVKNNLGGVVPYVIVRTNQKEVDPLLGNISETAPSNPEEGDFWYQVDHSAQTVTLMKYSGSAWAAATEKQSLTYTWYAQDKDGHAAEFDKAGKVIYLSAADIDSILTLQCDVSN